MNIYFILAIITLSLATVKCAVKILTSATLNRHYGAKPADEFFETKNDYENIADVNIINIYNLFACIKNESIRDCDDITFFK